MELLRLYAKREIETAGLYKGFKKTTLIDEHGKQVSVYPAGQKQPSKLKKTIVHNCFKYELNWLN